MPDDGSSGSNWLARSAVLVQDASSNTAIIWLTGIVLAVVVASESAIRNSRRIRLEKLVRNERRRDTIIRFLEREPELLDSLLILRLIATVVLTLAIADHVSERALSRHFNDLALTLGLVLLVLIVGVYGVVRQAVRASPEQYLLLLYHPIRMFDRVFLPVRWLLGQMGAGIARLLGVVRTTEDDEEEFREDILDAVSGGEHTGVLGEQQAEMIEKLVDFHDRAVSEVMTPRTRIVSLAVDTPLAQAVKFAVDSGHSRIPLHDGTVDHVVGILFVKDLLKYWDKAKEHPPALKSIMRRAPFVPETKRIKDILKDFQSGATHMAIVLDEYGGTAGLVTIEDVVEEIVGEIHDELDQEEAAQPDPLVVRSEHEAEVSARVRIDELNQALKLQLPDDGSYDTVGGFLFSKLGRIPHRGEDYAFENITFEILDADERQINRVKVMVGE